MKVEEGLGSKQTSWIGLVEGIGFVGSTRVSGVTVVMRSMSQSRSDTLGLASEAVMSLAPTSQCTTLCLEVCHADGWKSGCSMVFRVIMMNFMDRDGGVDNRRLDGLLLNNWLDSLEIFSKRERKWVKSSYLMNVVMDMLPSDGRGGRAGFLG